MAYTKDARRKSMKEGPDEIYGELMSVQKLPAEGEFSLQKPLVYLFNRIKTKKPMDSIYVRFDDRVIYNKSRKFRKIFHFYFMSYNFIKEFLIYDDFGHIMVLFVDVNGAKYYIYYDCLVPERARKFCNILKRKIPKCHELEEDEAMRERVSKPITPATFKDINSLRRSSFDSSTRRRSVMTAGETVASEEDEDSDDVSSEGRSSRGHRSDYNHKRMYGNQIPWVANNAMLYFVPVPMNNFSYMNYHEHADASEMFDHGFRQISPQPQFFPYPMHQNYFYDSSGERLKNRLDSDSRPACASSHFSLNPHKRYVDFEEEPRRPDSRVQFVGEEIRLNYEKEEIASHNFVEQDSTSDNSKSSNRKNRTSKPILEQILHNSDDYDKEKDSTPIMLNKERRVSDTF